MFRTKRKVDLKVERVDTSVLYLWFIVRKGMTQTSAAEKKRRNLPLEKQSLEKRGARAWKRTPVIKFPFPFSFRAWTRGVETQPKYISRIFSSKRR